MPTLSFVQDKQKISLKSKLGLLNALVRGWVAGWLPWRGDRATWAGPGRAGEAEARRTPEDVRSLPASAGLGFTGTGRKELSLLCALEEGSAAINSEPREGGREGTDTGCGQG